MVGRLDAKLYYGGILFGALTAGIAGLPLYINDMENKCVIMDRKQEDIEKLVAELNNRVRVLESERCVPKVNKLCFLPVFIKSIPTCCPGGPFIYALYVFCSALSGYICY
jgi:hypothetical protein